MYVMYVCMYCIIGHRIADGSAYPPRATIIEGNTHAPHPNGSAVLLIAGHGVQLTANEFGRRTATGGLENNVALIETCTDAHLCQSSVSEPLIFFLDFFLDFTHKQNSSVCQSYYSILL